MQTLKKQKKILFYYKNPATILEEKFFFNFLKPDV